MVRNTLRSTILLFLFFTLSGCMMASQKLVRIGSDMDGKPLYLQGTTFKAGGIATPGQALTYVHACVTEPGQDKDPDSLRCQDKSKLEDSQEGLGRFLIESGGLVGYGALRRPPTYRSNTTITQAPQSGNVNAPSVDQPQASSLGGVTPQALFPDVYIYSNPSSYSGSYSGADASNNCVGNSNCDNELEIEY